MKLYKITPYEISDWDSIKRHYLPILRWIDTFKRALWQWKPKKHSDFENLNWKRPKSLNGQYEDQIYLTIL